ncbi:MAG TPA: shikimate dehydrogenase [Candidatus Binatia bacterium]|nr:shikimate dehydrogenase [Candidatus Binatia bacterium]
MALRFAVLGQPIAHSLSPQIQEAFAQQLGQHISYEKLEVAPGQLKDTLARMHAEGYTGLALTLPHKVAAVALAVEVADPARIAGATNALIRRDAGWRADNTDGAGLVRDLKDHLKLGIAGKRVLLLGAGGAARGVLKPLLDEKPQQLVVSSRTPWNVEQLVAEFKGHGPVRASTHIALKGFQFDLVLNATSAGQQDRMPRIAAGVLAPGGACYDLNYGQAHAPFRAWAQSQDAAVVADGLGMLVEQAAEMAQLWYGRRPQTAPVLASLRGQHAR